MNDRILRRCSRVALAMAAPFALVLGGCDWLGFQPVALDFETLTSAAQYAVGESLTVGDVTITVLPFQWTDGTVYSGGFLTVANSQLAGGSGLDLNLNNVCLGFDFATRIDAVSLKFGEYGGNINVEINAILVNQIDFYGLTIGGIGFDINDLGAGLGTLAATGKLVSTPFSLAADSGSFNFIIGGQELWIDDVVAE